MKSNIIFYNDEEKKHADDVYDLANSYIEINDMPIEQQCFMIGYLAAA